MQLRSCERVEDLLADAALAERLGARRPALRARAAELAQERGGARRVLQAGDGALRRRAAAWHEPRGRTRTGPRARPASSPLRARWPARSSGEVAPPGNHGANASSWTIRETPLKTVVDRYEGAFALPPSSYGTVRDFADSAETMPGLAGANFDMKDMQRCWMIKAILGNVERGSRILEIGAGEPLVAGRPLAGRLRRDRGRPLRRQRQRAARIRDLQDRLPGPQVRPRAVPAQRGRRRRLRRRLLDLGPRARAAGGDRRGHRRRRRAAEREAGLLDPRHRPRPRRLGSGRTPGEAASGSPPGSGSPARTWARGDRRSSRPTRRPTSSPPSRTTAGAATFPTSSTRCGGSPPSTSSPRA